VQARLHVLPHAIVIAAWLPVLGEEYHAYSLAKVVELEASAPDSGHD
jgi:hypothetical protein